MRFNFLVALALIAPAALAQTPAASQNPAAPGILPPDQGQQSGASGNAPAGARPTAATLSNQVVPLSEAAKTPANPSPSPAPKVGAIQPTQDEAKAIAVVDGNGKIVDAASAKMPHGTLKEKADQPVRLPDIMLYRMSEIDGKRQAVMLVKGQMRRVQVGNQVLSYVISEMRDDGVCLEAADKGGDKHKDDKQKAAKCKPFLTFLDPVANAPVQTK